ncbi:nucleoporin-like protein 2 isoform X1 [Limulus polyphemus]|uniref:Nucleoporin NUP42 n=1 Tax=Limulus polyphemus TaxID=6850 RepID=A0ABM1BD91_LIMPO|nr:nucleoporin-like protein 2 isoform X1 [Limulus polyphemus]
MVICRFYLQGNCRYGSRCWNEHLPTRNLTIPNTSNSTSDTAFTQIKGRNVTPQPVIYDRNKYTWTPKDAVQKSTNGGFSFTKTLEQSRTFTQNRFAVLNQPVQQQEPQQIDSDVSLLEMVKQDILLWELGKQWPFSCYGHLKKQGCFPGFLDISPEELRWTAYYAQREGNTQSYLHLVKQALEDVQTKRKELQKASPDILRILESLDEGSSENQQLKLFQVTGEISQFGFNITPSFHGTPQAHTAEESIFGKSLQLSSFGKSAQPSSSLNSQANLEQSAFQLALLGSPEQSSSFSKRTSESLSLFGKPTMVLSSSDKPSDQLIVSSKPAENTSLIGSEVSNKASGFSFTEQLSAARQVGMTTSSFQKATGQNNEMTSILYTPLAVLKNTEKEQFSTPTFTLGKIPLRPPPRELCC